MNKVLAKRLREARKDRGFSQKSLADRIGVGQSTISMIEQGKVDQPDHIIELARAVGKTPEWLLGMEEGWAPEPDLPPDRTATYSEEAGSSHRPPGGISHIDTDIGLGHAAEAQHFVVPVGNGETTLGAKILDYWIIPPAFLPARIQNRLDECVFIQCLGNSMDPLIKDGDVVLIDTGSKIPSPPGIFAVWDGLGVTLKEVEVVDAAEPFTIRLIPHNKDYSSYERTLEEARIIGRYVGRFTAS